MKWKIWIFLVIFLNLLFISFSYACDTNSWTLIFKHDVSSWDVFLDNNEALSFNTGLNPYSTWIKKFSKLSELENYRLDDWKFEFKLSYPNLSPKKINRRKQVSNPTTWLSNWWVVWYEPILIQANGNRRWWLEYNWTTTTFIDWSVNHSNWWYAIWAKKEYPFVWSNTIPWPSVNVDYVELYVCNPFPKAYVSYSETWWTNQNVISTITILTWNWIHNCVILNNSWNINHIFTWNWTFTYNYSCLDEYWATITWTKTATVNNIDKIKPTAIIEYWFTLPTSWTVWVTLTWFSETWITIMNNSGSNYFLFTWNWTFTFIFKDKAWNTWETTAIVNNIRPEYPIEQSYYPYLRVNQTEISDWTRVFTWSDPKNCIYRTLRVNLWSSSYIVIPAWTCWRTTWTVSDYYLQNTNIQRIATDKFSYFFWKSNLNIIFNKPIKFMFNRRLFDWWSFQKLYYKSNFLDTRQISNTYYTVCNDWVSSIQMNDLHYYRWYYIWYTCKWWNFELQYSPKVPDPTPIINNYDNSSTSNSNSSSYTNNSYNTNNYYYDTWFVKELLSWMADIILKRELQIYSWFWLLNNTTKNSNIQTTVKIDNIWNINQEKLKQDILNQAKLMWLRLNREILSAYVYWRVKWILTNKYYDEKDLLKNIDRWLTAIMFNRFGENVLHLIPQSYNCNFIDIDTLDFNTKQHILSACKYWFIGYTDQTEWVLSTFRPNEYLTRQELINIIARTLKIDEHNKQLVHYVLKDKNILSDFSPRIENKFTILKVMIKLEKYFDKIDKQYLKDLEKKFPYTYDKDIFWTYDWNNQKNKNNKADKNLGHNYSVKYYFSIPYKVWYKWKWVIALQKFLKEYWVFEWKINGYYWLSTAEALYKFQLKEWLISPNAPDYLKWYLWPSTRSRINDLLN